MGKIDSLIKHLYEFKAEGLGIRSDRQVVLFNGAEQQPITAQPLAAPHVELLLGEIVPIEQLESCAQIGKHNFTYDSPFGSAKVLVHREARSLNIFVKPSEPLINSRATAAASVSARVGAAPAASFEPASPARSAAPAPAVAQSTASAQPDPPSPASSVLPVAQVEPVAADDPRPDIPEPTPGSCALDPYLKYLIKQKGSDLYVCTSKPPIIRRDGDLEVIDGQGPMGDKQVEELLYSVTTMRHRHRFRDTNDVDFAYELPGVARFRANLFRDRNGMGGIFRQIPNDILTAEALNLPKCVLELCHLPKGLIVVTGPTGSGKSTTLAAMVDYINRVRPCHIITIEDPIEFVHPDKRCVINQREVGAHTDGFKQALRAALREDPDIVLVGEMRDLETVAIAIETAETGHVVFGTLHTNTAASTVDRIIDQFPADRQSQIRTMLSESLRGVVAQTLCKKKGGGRVAALEILIVTPSVANIIREGKTFQIPSIMQTGRSVGMATMNYSLLELVKSGQVDVRDAYERAINKSELLTLLEQNNLKPRELEH